MRFLVVLGLIVSLFAITTGCKSPEDKFCEKLEEWGEDGGDCKEDAVVEVKERCENPDEVFNCVADAEKEEDGFKCMKKCEKKEKE